MRFLLVALAALVFAAPVASSNMPHPTLDQVATEVAGKPVAVWCESSVTDWDRAVYTASRGTQIGAQILGFTYISAPTVYLSPSQCQTLHFALQVGYHDVGVSYLSSAVLTLVHEGVHQRGVTDEGVTDCTALPLVVPMMEKYFGLTQTVPGFAQETYTKVVRRKIAGKWRNIRVSATRIVNVVNPNPDYARAAAWAVAWHRGKPAAYQGGC